MKKYLLLLILPFMFLNNVKAESITFDYGLNYFNLPYFDDNKTYSAFETWYDDNIDIISYLREGVLNLYSSSYSTSNPYYIISLRAVKYSDNGIQYQKIFISLFFYSNTPSLYIGNSVLPGGSCVLLEDSTVSCLKNTAINAEYDILNDTYISPSVSAASDPFSYSFQSSNIHHYEDFLLFESNFNLTYNENSYYDTITISNFRDKGNISFSKGDIIPITTTNMIDIDYTTVNLDNYEYVLLSLKNYNQVEPFQTNFQLKGQIGITPIYNYGQTSKDSITGVKVQDRCNLEYSDYTLYPFYIIQTDLQNNAIYAVKSCSSGSSFKFDNTVFDITYITSENKDNPTITIGGKTYNVIPYSDLPSSATENEENNYIPGESGSATDVGGIDSAIKSIQQKMSEIWNIFTYFTDFIGQMFSVLPTELKTVLLSAFIVAVVLGLIKIFIN